MPGEEIATVVVLKQLGRGRVEKWESVNRGQGGKFWGDGRDGGRG